MSDKKTNEQQVANPSMPLKTQPLPPLEALQLNKEAQLPFTRVTTQSVSQPANTQPYQNELQQQRLRNLAAQLDAITDPGEKMQFIENRLLENLQHLKRQLAILQQGIPGGAGLTGDKTDC